MQSSFSVNYRRFGIDVLFPETSVTNYQSKMRNISEERRLTWQSLSLCQ